MKVKSNNVLKDLKERTTIYRVGMDGAAFPIWRRDANTLRMYIPIILSGEIKNWYTNDQSNTHMVHGFFNVVAKSDTTVTAPSYADTPLGATQINRTENGLAIDFTAPGDVSGGTYVIQNLLTIETY